MGTVSTRPILPTTVRMISVANISWLIILANEAVEVEKKRSRGNAAPVYARARVLTSAPTCSLPTRKALLYTSFLARSRPERYISLTIAD